jgi:hypothetical protein
MPDCENYWNVTNQPGTNIIGGPNIGGNYWTNSSSLGYSNNCTDTNKDGFCDDPYSIYGGGMVDYLPLTDINPPRWSNNQSFTPAIVSSTPSTFNITWTDNIAVYKVFIEGNWSGSPQNYTMTYISSGVYGYQEVLPAGNFYWKSYANDTRNNSNVSDTWYFTIQPKTCGLSVNTTNINFGNVEAGQTSTSQTVAVTNTGNSPTTGFTVYGTAWTGGTGMPVGQTSVFDTVWHTLPDLYSPLTIFGGVINNGETKDTQFKVAIPEGQTAASYIQTITFTGSC